MQNSKGALDGLRVFDMTRVLAGPSATQILGDLGAEVIKIEKPGAGDDTRGWGPPFLKDNNGNDTQESAYYLCANRNKKSVTLDFTKPEGLTLAKKIISTCDILVENFKTGSLDRHGLGYETLKQEYPGLIYCSITGFGHTGPLKDDAGYDFMIQAMGGIMSVTGDPGGAPMKCGVAIADLMAGMYAATGILAALHHRDKTGQGQHIDLALFDSQVAWLANVGQYYLTSENTVPRLGNAHSTIVPYEAFMAQDGWIVLAVGNDRQFRDFCTLAGKPELADDPRFETNAKRVVNRAALTPIVKDIIAAKTVTHWMKTLEEKRVPCGPVQTVDQVFAHPQTKARNMTMTLPHPASPEPVTLTASPLKMSATPATYRHAPPTLGQHTHETLKNLLAMNDDDIAHLQQQGVI